MVDTQASSSERGHSMILEGMERDVAVSEEKYLIPTIFNTSGCISF